MPPPRKRRHCQYCGREFNKHEHLIRHENSHANVRPYVCQICQKGFGRRDVLTRHEKTCASHVGEVEHGPAVAPPGFAPGQQQPMHNANGPTPAFAPINVSIPVTMGAGPALAPAQVPAYVPPPMQPHFATADIDFATYDPFSADLHSLFGEDVLANLPPMHDFWTADVDGDFDLGMMEGSSNGYGAGSPSGSSNQDESVLDRIAEKWPKLARPSGKAKEQSRPSSSHGWSSTYNELKAGITFAPIEPPSTAFLAAAVHHFFRDFQKDHPFINEANFAPHQHPPLLVLAICASGARFMPTSQAANFAQQVFERMSILLARNWSASEEQNSETQLDLIRAALLLQFHCLSSGSQKLIGHASALQGSIVAHARQMQLLSPGGPVDFKPGSMPDMHALSTVNGTDDIDPLWKAWITAEEARRVVAMILHTEAYLHSLIREDAPPYMAPVAAHVVLPSDETGDAFAAKDALSWAQVVSARPLKMSDKLIELVRRLYERTVDMGAPEPLSVYALRFQLDSLYQQERCRRLSILPRDDGTTPSDVHSLFAIEKWRQAYLSKAIEPTSEDGKWRLLELKMTWHAHNLSHLLDLAGLEVAHGKEGQTASIDARQRLESMRGTSALNRALLHAGSALGALARVPRGTSGGMPLFTICFKSALLLATFALPSAPGAAFSLSDPVDWDKIALAGIDSLCSRPVFPESLMLSPAARFVWEGGNWSVNNLQTSVDILRWTADALTTLGGSSKPIGPVLGSILRLRADGWT